MNKKIILIGIILLAVFLRFQNIAWDQGFHLHPDERFLTMVGVAMKIPKSVIEYLNPTTSTLNPANIGFPFFVYGVFPVILNKILAVFLNNNSYGLFALQGRILAGITDLLTLFLVFKTAQLLANKLKLTSSFVYKAAFFYAIAVLPIQLSHFFAVDIFLNTFVFASFYFSLRFYYSHNQKDVFISAIFFGLAMASKINAVYVLPLLLFFFTFSLIKQKKILYVFITIIFFCISSYAILRFTEPYYFQTNDFISLQPSELLAKNLRELQVLSSDKILYPPSIQWLNKTPVLFSLFNLVFFGLGLPYFILACLGVFNTFFLFRKKKAPYEIYAIFIWIIVFFLYSSMQFAKTMRYLICIIPFLSLFASMGLEKLKKIRWYMWLFLLLWPFIFSSIYFQPHTRVQASLWIYQHILDKSTILTEYWDDPLPLPIAQTKGKQLNIKQIPVFDPDTEEKWQKLNKELMSADYYILSSNRAWASIPTISSKYPRMSQYYKDLFDGKTRYKLVKKFIPLYQYIFPFHPASWFNYWFDESFTVYDHPPVFIFQNTKKSN